MSSVAEFYRQRALLVTGGSGFLGKVIVEKLLRSTPSLRTIYLIIRPQHGLSPKQRLDKLLESQVRLSRGAVVSAPLQLFDLVRRECPERFDKLVAVGGNLMEPELGLSEPDRHRLCDDVSVVFHCAATVKFDEQLRISVEMNVVGTQRLIALCHKMSRLAAFVHASTAYANCDRTRIIESVYPPPIQPQKLIESLEWMSDEMVDALTPHIVGRRPNTYTLTKALAEFVLVRECGRLPVVIVRPSVIAAVWREPLPGWTDNLNGPTGVIAGAAKGLLTNICVDPTATADIVPVDAVAAFMIVAAAHRAASACAAAVAAPPTPRFSDESVPVINFTSGQLNPVKWIRILKYFEAFFRTVPIEKPYRVPSSHGHTSKLLYEVNFFIKLTLPAYLIDFCYKLMGKKPYFVKVQRKLVMLLDTLHYFTTRGWDFQAKLMLNAWQDMSDEDKQLFNFDVRQVDWERYMYDYMLGVKKFIFKEDVANLPRARSYLARLKAVTTLLHVCAAALLARLLGGRSRRAVALFIISCAAQLHGLYRRQPFTIPQTPPKPPHCPIAPA